jgi:thiosulfate/3-mercaptopyruvate sulfurtransferase
MPPFPLPPLISTDWLAGHLREPGLVILDASWYLPASGRDARGEYLAGHLPGALWFDLDLASDADSSLPHMLPSADAFAAYAGTLGIGTDSAVVVYDGSGANLSAARAWWMFRAYGHSAAALLDGGLGKWRAEGKPLERGPVVRSPVGFSAHFDAAAVRDLASVRVALAKGSAQVVDVRSAGRFSGAEAEPRPGLPSGHMPGALNLPYVELVQRDGTALTLPQLVERLAQAGISPDRPVIATCGSGTSACTLLLALHRLGRSDIALYDGSWTEWASSGMPIEPVP